MPIPQYQEIMLPLLKLAEDKKEHSTKEATEYIIHFFKTQLHSILFYFCDKSHGE